MAYRHLDCESGSERLCQHEELRGFTDLGSASYWMEICFNQSEALPSEAPHQYGPSTLVSQTSFRGETSGCVEKCHLFSHATHWKC